MAKEGADGVALITVWTKQHRSVWDTLEREGRYTARREFIEKDLQEHAGLVLEVYDWLVAHGPDSANRPPDAEYPVWVSFARETTMLPSEGTVILELEVEERLITPVHIGKWGCILNYSYIPADAEDARRHERLLADYGISDAKAYMSRFYPAIKRDRRQLGPIVRPGHPDGQRFKIREYMGDTKRMGQTSELLTNKYNKPRKTAVSGVCKLF